jgi:hypothetical protein
VKFALLALASTEDSNMSSTRNSAARLSALLTLSGVAFAQKFGVSITPNQLPMRPLKDFLMSVAPGTRKMRLPV